MQSRRKYYPEYNLFYVHQSQCVFKRMDEFTIMGVECTSFDLTYPLSESTIFWPNGEGFNLCMTCSTDGGLHYAAGTFACAEHCGNFFEAFLLRRQIFSYSPNHPQLPGTHVDAPFHFAAHGATVDLIPLRNLVSKCRVIDVSAKCSIETSGNYAVTHDDICEHESIYGPIEPASTVLIRTGWSQHYASGAKVYLGYDESEQGPYSVETSSLHFPGIGEDAAHILVARKVVAVGLDTGLKNSIHEHIQ